MKKIKKMIAILSLAMMLGITAIPNLAYAMPSEENAAIETVAAYVEENAEEFSDERIPIETVYFVERQIVANPNIKLNLSFFTLFPQIIPAFSSIPSDYS